MRLLEIVSTVSLVAIVVGSGLLVATAVIALWMVSPFVLAVFVLVIFAAIMFLIAGEEPPSP